MSEGIIAAAATIAAGAVALTQFNKDQKDPVEKPPAIGSAGGNTLSDKSAELRAQGLANYGYQYYQSVKENARTNLLIGILQQAAAFYLADKQHDTAKQAQRRFDEIWHNQKDKSDKFFAHWWDNGRPLEIAMLNEARNREQRGYAVDYETAKQRAVVGARSEFARAREKIQRESRVHCVGATRTALRQLHAAEARAAVLATNQAIRLEEERKHQRESQYREESYKWIALTQGRISDSLNALRTAQQAAAGASAIDPYQGWAQAIGNLSNIGVGVARMNTADFGMMTAHHLPNLIQW